MMRVVVDSSVAYKWLRPFGESSVPQALELVQSAAEGIVELVAPALLHIELANTIRYTGLPHAEIESLIDEMGGFGVTLYDTDLPRLESAVRLALRHNLSVYDALFLQLAQELDCPLVTADRRAFANLDTEVEIRLL
jgi:predicted nucleic acid-binding protein